MSRSKAVRVLTALCALVIPAVGAACGAGEKAQAETPRQPPATGGPYEPAGGKIRGGASEKRATPIETGRYRDTTPGATSSRFYSVRRSMKQSSLYVAVATRPEKPVSDAGLYIQVRTPEGVVCAKTGTNEDNEDASRWLITAVASSWRAGERELCASASRLVVQVAQNSEEPQFAGKPMEILVNEEPPARSPSRLPAYKEKPQRWKKVADSTRSEALPGSSSPSTAPLVEPGSYAGAIRPGELRFYRVRLDWGQWLQTRALVRKPAEDLADSLDYGQELSLQIIAPTGGPAGVDNEDLPIAGWTDLVTDAATEIGEMTYPVRFRNRDSPDEHERPASVPGEYLVGVALEDDVDDDDYAVPYHLRVDVLGKRSGAPTYAGTPKGPAWPTATDAASDRALDTRAYLLGGGGLLLFLTGAVTLIALRRTPGSSKQSEGAR